ncbi:hypothetical protein AAIR98_001764 [Elusimicrobium simillimum]|uniref:hypothetical protein n=1 Tax=Elusimicrobium simillimum TaxID=3143438 RepID=UPI003C6FCB40
MPTQTAAQNSLEAVYQCIAATLPKVQDDVAEKIAYAYANKKSAKQLAQEVNKLKEDLLFNIPEREDYVAKILLDKVTVPAAAKALRIIKNKDSIAKFQRVLGLPYKTRDLLTAFYASTASVFNFDEEFSEALAAVGYKEKESQELALEAVNRLEQKALDAKHAKDHSKQNKEDIEAYTLKYKIPLKDCYRLLSIYATYGAKHFKSDFDDVLAKLQNIFDKPALTSFLTVKTLNGFLTLQDAVNFTAMAKEIPYAVAEDDIFVLGCRYLRTKTTRDVIYTLDAILKRLPFSEIKEENLGLAIGVLTEGSQESLDIAMKRAQKFKDRSIFRKALAKHECFEGFTYDIAKKFAGKSKVEELLEKFNTILGNLNYCSGPAENNDLAAKVLLGKITEAEAATQATYRRDLKAKSLTEGLAPEVLKKYLGTLSPEDIMAFFDSSLTPYSFWKTDQEKHLYALEALIAQLNGTSSGEITNFVFEQLQDGAELEEISEILTKIPSKDRAKITAAQIKANYLNAPPAAAESLSSIFES